MEFLSIQLAAQKAIARAWHTDSGKVSPLINFPSTNRAKRAPGLSLSTTKLHDVRLVYAFFHTNNLKNEQHVV